MVKFEKLTGEWSGSKPS